jgi:phospholipid/cholesterol/gamma-HCH transport system substrate-binding protein
MLRRRPLAVVGVVVLALVAGCTIETATAPTGDLTLYAAFDDAQDLTPGHFVQASNVVVGSVTGIELDGYRARATLSIVDDQEVPVGTEAVIRRTSLLGEHYVDLVFPESFDPERGPFMASGDTIEVTDAQADLEDLAGQAAEIVGAVTANDVAGIVRAGATGLDGRGAVLNQLVADARQVADALARQQAAINSAIDDAGTLGAALAPADDRVATLLDQLASVTGTVAGDRARLVQTLASVIALASTTTDQILVPHADRLVTLLDQLEPIVGDLAGRTDVLAGLVTDLLRFTEALPTAIHNGSILLLTWVFLDVPLLDDIGLRSQDPLDTLLDFVGGGPR